MFYHKQKYIIIYILQYLYENNIQVIYFVKIYHSPKNNFLYIFKIIQKHVFQILIFIKCMK